MAAEPPFAGPEALERPPRLAPDLEEPALDALDCSIAIFLALLGFFAGGFNTGGFFLPAAVFPVVEPAVEGGIL